MSPRESIREKAVRYLGDGRLAVEHVAQGRVVASCRGDHGAYAVDFDPRRGKWACDCPARKTCCHITATELVTGTASQEPEAEA